MKKKYLIFFPVILIFSYIFSEKYFYPTNVERVDAYFSLYDNCSNILINEIDKTENSIEFSLYFFTNNKIYEALKRARGRGVKVRGVIDKSCLGKKDSVARKLKKDGIVIKVVGREGGLMHHKFIILDRKIVITGSYNYTYSADYKNDENIVVIHSRRISSKYLQEFDRLTS